MGTKQTRGGEDHGWELAGLLALLIIVIVSVAIGVMIGMHVE